MKKITLVAFILLTKVCATNAQQFNNTQPENAGVASATTAATMNLNTSLNLPVKNALRLNPDPVVVHDKAYYLKKSRNNRIASFSLVGGGLVIAGIGALTFPKDYDIIFGNSSEKESKADVSTALMVVGVAAMLSSIPFTVMASVNKRRANAMVASQKTGSGMVPAGVSKNITGITMTIPIGK